MQHEQQAGGGWVPPALPAPFMYAAGMPWGQGPSTSGAAPAHIHPASAPMSMGAGAAVHVHVNGHPGDSSIGQRQQLSPPAPQFEFTAAVPNSAHWRGPPPSHMYNQPATTTCASTAPAIAIAMSAHPSLVSPEQLGFAPPLYPPDQLYLPPPPPQAQQVHLHPHALRPRPAMPSAGHIQLPGPTQHQSAFAPQTSAAPSLHVSAPVSSILQRHSSHMGENDGRERQNAALFSLPGPIQQFYDPLYGYPPSTSPAPTPPYSPPLYSQHAPSRPAFEAVPVAISTPPAAAVPPLNLPRPAFPASTGPVALPFAPPPEGNARPTSSLEQPPSRATPSVHLHALPSNPQTGHPHLLTDRGSSVPPSSKRKPFPSHRRSRSASREPSPAANRDPDRDRLALPHAEPTVVLTTGDSAFEKPATAAYDHLCPRPALVEGALFSVLHLPKRIRFSADSSSSHVPVASSSSQQVDAHAAVFAREGTAVSSPPTTSRSVDPEPSSQSISQAHYGNDHEGGTPAAAVADSTHMLALSSTREQLQPAMPLNLHSSLHDYDQADRRASHAASFEPDLPTVRRLEDVDVDSRDEARGGTSAPHQALGEHEQSAAANISQQDLTIPRTASQERTRCDVAGDLPAAESHGEHLGVGVGHLHRANKDMADGSAQAAPKSAFNSASDMTLAAGSSPVQIAERRSQEVVADCNDGDGPGSYFVPSPPDSAGNPGARSSSLPAHAVGADSTGAARAARDVSASAATNEKLAIECSPADGAAGIYPDQPASGPSTEATPATGLTDAAAADEKFVIPPAASAADGPQSSVKQSVSAAFTEPPKPPEEPAPHAVDMETAGELHTSAEADAETAGEVRPSAEGADREDHAHAQLQVALDAKASNPCAAATTTEESRGDAGMVTSEASESNDSAVEPAAFGVDHGASASSGQSSPCRDASAAAAGTSSPVVERGPVPSTGSSLNDLAVPPPLPAPSFAEVQAPPSHRDSAASSPPPVDPPGPSRPQPASLAEHDGQAEGIHVDAGGAAAERTAMEVLVPADAASAEDRASSGDGIDVEQPAPSPAAGSDLPTPAEPPELSSEPGSDSGNTSVARERRASAGSEGDRDRDEDQAAPDAAADDAGEDGADAEQGAVGVEAGPSASTAAAASPSVSGTGVKLDSRHGTWFIATTVNGARIQTPRGPDSWKSQEAAARARDRWLIFLLGPNEARARLSFPVEEYNSEPWFTSLVQGETPYGYRRLESAGGYGKVDSEEKMYAAMYHGYIADSFLSEHNVRKDSQGQQMCLFWPSGNVKLLERLKTDYNRHLLKPLRPPPTSTQQSETDAGTEDELISRRRAAPEERGRRRARASSRPPTDGSPEQPPSAGPSKRARGAGGGQPRESPPSSAAAGGSGAPGRAGLPLDEGGASSSGSAPVAHPSEPEQTESMAAGDIERAPKPPPTAGALQSVASASGELQPPRDEEHASGLGADEAGAAEPVGSGGKVAVVAAGQSRQGPSWGVSSCPTGWKISISAYNASVVSPEAFGWPSEEAAARARDRWQIFLLGPELLVENPKLNLNFPVAEYQSERWYQEMERRKGERPPFGFHLLGGRSFKRFTAAHPDHTEKARGAMFHGYINFLRRHNVERDAQGRLARAFLFWPLPLDKKGKPPAEEELWGERTDKPRDGEDVDEVDWGGEKLAVKWTDSEVNLSSLKGDARRLETLPLWSPAAPAEEGGKRCTRARSRPSGEARGSPERPPSAGPGKRARGAGGGQPRESPPSSAAASGGGAAAGGRGAAAGGSSASARAGSSLGDSTPASPPSEPELAPAVTPRRAVSGRSADDQGAPAPGPSGAGGASAPGAALSVAEAVASLVRTGGRDVKSVRPHGGGAFFSVRKTLRGREKETTCARGRAFRSAAEAKVFSDCAHIVLFGPEAVAAGSRGGLAFPEGLDAARADSYLRMPFFTELPRAAEEGRVVCYLSGPAMERPGAEKEILEGVFEYVWGALDGLFPHPLPDRPGAPATPAPSRKRKAAAGEGGGGGARAKAPRRAGASAGPSRRDGTSSSAEAPPPPVSAPAPPLPDAASASPDGAPPDEARSAAGAAATPGGAGSPRGGASSPRSAAPSPLPKLIDLDEWDDEEEEAEEAEQGAGGPLRTDGCPGRAAGGGGGGEAGPDEPGSDGEPEVVVDVDEGDGADREDPESDGDEDPLAAAGSSSRASCGDAAARGGGAGKAAVVGGGAGGGVGAGPSGRRGPSVLVWLRERSLELPVPEAEPGGGPGAALRAASALFGEEVAALARLQPPGAGPPRILRAAAELVPGYDYSALTRDDVIHLAERGLALPHGP